MLLATCLVANAKAGTTVLGENVMLSCQQFGLERLDCNYQFLRPSRVVAISAALGNQELPPPSFEKREPSEGISAILMLIDTSDPAREDAVARIVAHAKGILSKGLDQHQFGLATFDSELRMVKPLGSRPEDLKTALDNIHAEGKTTELYRSALDAVRILTAYPADRRALFLFSDGQAEDHAYFHRDVVRAALDGGVAIYGIGYARSVSLSVALQSLRRLADETGGRFVVADSQINLPAQFSSRPFESLDSGGTLSVDITGVDPGITGKGYNAQLVWTLVDGGASAKTPLDFSKPTSEPIIKIVEVEVPKVVEVPRYIEVEVPASMPKNRGPTGQLQPPGGLTDTRAEAVQNQLMVYLPYLILGAGIVILPLGLILTFLRQRRTESVVVQPAEEAPEVHTFAFLEIRDGSDERHPITRAAFRIGRHQDNDLVIRDPSISRYHAELHRLRDGSFTVTDLDSLNGLFVNNKKVGSSTLADGDTVEVGDVAFKFSIQRKPSDPGEDETVVLKTSAPEFKLSAVAEKSA